MALPKNQGEPSASRGMQRCNKGEITQNQKLAPEHRGIEGTPSYRGTCSHTWDLSEMDCVGKLQADRRFDPQSQQLRGSLTVVMEATATGDKAHDWSSNG